MIFENVQKIRSLGSNPRGSQDALVQGTLACVIDCVPGTSDNPNQDADNSEADWFTEKLAQGIQRNALKWETLSKVVETAVDELLVEVNGPRELPSQPIHTQPSASLAMVRLRKKNLDFFVLGDCKIVILPPHGEPRLIRDDRKRETDDKIVGLVHSLQGLQKLTHAEACVKAYPLVRRQRDVLNEADGFYAVTLDRKGIYQAITGTVPLSSCKQALLCTKGFASAVELFHLIEWGGLFHDQPLENLVSSLRTAELRDSECTQYPRLESSQNASAIRLHIASRNSKFGR